MEQQCVIIDNYLCIRMPKEVDHHGAAGIREHADKLLLDDKVRNIVFDFEDTTFMDSSGIGLVLGRVRKIHPINGKVYLFGGNELIQKMWEMAGILNLVTVLDSIEKVKEVYE